MKNLLCFIFLIFILNLPTQASSFFQGGVSEEGYGNSSRIVDRHTGEGVGGAKITLPKQRYSTLSDSNGYFELDTHIDGTTIMSVQKDNYKPFSVTINEQANSAPLVVGIEKSNTSGMVLDSNMYHLGDNNFSDLSANAGEFRMASIGPFYSKNFQLKNIKLNKPIFLVEKCIKIFISHAKMCIIPLRRCLIKTSKGETKHESNFTFYLFNLSL